MNNLKVYIIGNGFDLAHDLNTKYTQFILWLLKNILTKRDSYSEYKAIFSVKSTLSSEQEKRVMEQIERVECYEDLEQITLIALPNVKNSSLRSQIYGRPEKRKRPFSERVIISAINDPRPKLTLSSHNKLFSRSLTNFSETNWSGIEVDYYRLFAEENAHNKKSSQCRNGDPSIEIKKLNDALTFLKKELVKYLGEETEEITKRKDLATILSNSGSGAVYVNYNYTPTLIKYDLDSNSILHPHGNLKEPDSIIFGFGSSDESITKQIMNSSIDGSSFSKLDGLKKLKSLMQQLDKQKFDLVILGHSCSKCDGLSLKKFLNHSNLDSIKIYARNINEYKSLQQNLCESLEVNKHFEKIDGFSEKYILV